MFDFIEKKVLLLVLLIVDTFINGLPNTTTEDERIKATGEPSTSNFQQLAPSTNNDTQDRSSNSFIVAIALGVIAGLSCLITSILLAILITQRRSNGINATIMYDCILL